MNTIFRPVPGYADLYASMDQRIVLAGSGELEQKTNPCKNYRYVYIPGVGTREVHRLFASAFLGEIPKGIQVRHADSDKQNNTIGNFCYGTPKDNTKDAIEFGAHGAAANAAKTECRQGHPYSPENTYTAPNGNRQCRKCRAHHARIAETKRDRAAELREQRARIRRAD